MIINITKENQERIKVLDSLDQKDLPKKYVKILEELGELSEAYLEVEGWKIKKDIKPIKEMEEHLIEEVADVLIMIHSVMYTNKLDEVIFDGFNLSCFYVYESIASTVKNNYDNICEGFANLTQSLGRLFVASNKTLKYYAVKESLHNTYKLMLELGINIKQVDDMINKKLDKWAYNIEVFNERAQNNAAK